MIFFFQFLQTGGRWEEFLRECPLHYTGNRGSGARNVMGTVLLSVLSGHWLSTQILGSISPAPGLPWILDIDVTVKPLYGHQQGAEIGYNPQKPGRPSHLYHSYFVANLVALFYNWWSLYLRFYDEEHHREAIRTRPMLMSGVGRQIQSGGRRTVKVGVLHEKGELIAQAVTRISNELHRIRAMTERWSVDLRWTLLLNRLLRRWLGGKWLTGLPEDAGLLLSG